MGSVVTFENYRPIAREDGQPWTSVEIYEGPSALGPWTLIDTLDLDPVDVDPSSPQSRSFTTTEGTLDFGWYRVTFRDAANNRQETTPVAYPERSAVLPSWLTLDELKKRIDRENVDDELLADLLEAAFAQAQEPAPRGCGRLLVADPPLAGAEDTADPVERELVVAGRMAFVPDAREIVEVHGYGDALIEAGTAYGNYRTIEKDGVIVALRLATDRVRSWRSDPAWPTTITVTGRFGIVDPPQNLVEGIYALAGRMYFERDAQYADQVRVAEGATGEAYFRQLSVRTKLAFESMAVSPLLAGLQ